ncbi:YegS/Rv2252/BmrU family lipid kinase [Sphingomonadales bacterium 56]|jgi:YegS/Rv2252/BmrU family lipid kinase|uniref:diacylglycerol/lipid kinase family protein n=1 Tax=unclassified Sphingobium TaxID=2611147 RepID=UPI001917B032|nr:MULTISPECIES: YegS/Rv2252/BmrU family lipid kinase [unclassified Sphingobium]MBY2927222.1 YegS/Rv2252/BmrU family lipid kinase [Sphingomonadales bacterium 56]MBY2957290.1 YegS/Rv2252/BmrU family lipid kinase [Sphingomonadales bacterium 58]CAD7334759.1 Putative lipid kinase BmrU [Sphingobium sp. S8]CAD7334778.1 Putative lipid kinase BmrU [Sphingobium sp. S6]
METNSLPREAALIVNVHSRKGEALFEQAREKLEAAGVRLIAAHAVRDPARLQDTVRQAVSSGAPMVIVGGGDGSLSGTVDELVGKNCVFGVLPLGTANSFARTLGIGLDLDSAVETIANGRRRRIDLGMIDGDYFVNAASLGLSPMIGETVPHKLKRYLGRIGYLLWAVKCSAGFRAFRLTIDDGKAERRMWSTEVRILNGPYHGGVELSDRADVDSGEIVIQAVVGRSHARLAWDWYAKFFKLRDRDARTEEYRGQSFRIETRPRQRISIDGEVVARTPATVKIAPGAIDVAVPR